MKKKLYVLPLMAALLAMTLPAVSYAEALPVEEEEDSVYAYEELPLEREGIALHLDCVSCEDADPDKNILLVHGLTYSSHEFDIDYEDYSLVRFLAREGYSVWRIDVAGYGRSGAVEDGFTPDSDYAAEDIEAAIEAIVDATGDDTIDMLGWSWGTVTSGRFAAKYPEYLRRLVLYAPILSGLGDVEVTDDFHYNTWEHAADDFQKNEDGSFDLTITDPVIIDMYCSSCWHYDRDYSPNGGRRDLCVDSSQELIDLTSIECPTLVICGYVDPYLNYELVDDCLNSLPDGSEFKKVEGASHALFLEEPYYHEFQDTVLDFLEQ
ncbi:MAG: alpha/beta hydrolase [Blautia sp.]|nr:alpha/beta hydrolase [Blautia sp.]